MRHRCPLAAGRLLRMNQPSGSLLCPRCQLPLHLGQAGGESLSGCAACGGIWLDSHGSARLTQALTTDALALADSAAQGAYHQADTLAADLPCPVCRQPLVRVAGADVPVPMSEPLEDVAIPSVEAIVAGIRAAVR